MRLARPTRCGLVLLTVFVAAVLLAPGATTLWSIPAESRLPAILPASAEPGSRLMAMVTAGTPFTPTDGRIRVGPNLQTFDDPQPQNEIAVAVNPLDDRNVLVGSNDYRLRAVGASVWVGMYTTDDAGKTWTANLVPGYPGGPRGILSTYQFGGDPILAFDRDGSAYAGGIFFRGTPTGGDIRDVSIALSRSDDGGFTWNKPVIVAFGKAQSIFHDHPQMTADATGGAFDGNVYISWTRFGGVGQIDILVAASSDRGATWTIQQVSGPIPQGDAQGYYQDSMVTVGPNGEVYVVWDEWFLDQGAVPRTKIWMTASRDGGATFAPSWVAEADVAPISLPNAAYRHDTYPVAAADASTGPFRGRLYLTWADQGTGDADILLKSSDDGGVTWSSPVRVNDDAGTAAQFFPWVAVGPDGRVDVAFYDRRDDPNDYLLNEYVARSQDGGRSFVNVRVSDASSDPAVWSSFIGDYNQIAAGTRMSWPAWSDFRNGVPGNRNQDAYTAAVFA